ncbi:hypothetical protein SJ059_30810, partial [Klebsiella aerogenes]|nr:hypothetical protein [Klebsiella aerogenes]
MKKQLGWHMRHVGTFVLNCEVNINKMLSDLLIMVDRRAQAVSLREKTIINERHAVRMLEPVLSLG